MEAFYVFLNDLVNKNKQDYSGEFQVQWLNSYLASEQEEKRSALVQQFSGQILFKETKPYCNQISEGCQLCGKGLWSCLFITNKCNANCFYCPTEQKNDEVPNTQNLSFSTPEAYAEYINYFGFKGVSFSGGEPLLYFDRVVDYLKALRKSCSPDIYIWMYTNGILADTYKLRRLAECGLDEIRFNIGATNYSIEAIQRAKGLINNITVEIPAVPEERDRLILLLPKLIDAGVSNLNLHQLRLTKYNYHRLLQKDYTYIPAERPLVMESELTALEVLTHVKNNCLPIGVNYCSFHFKNRFQKAGYRKMIAAKLGNPDDQLTENGFIRKKAADRIHYEKLVLADEDSDIKPNRGFALSFKKYKLTRYLASEKLNVPAGLQFEVDQLVEREPFQIPTDELLFKIWQKEYIERGIRSYF
ncbi:MAG: radical SAM protein [Marinifilaceae bacterium]